MTHNAISELLLMFLFMILLNGQSSAKEVKGILGKDIVLEFKFHNISHASISSASIYKNHSDQRSDNTKIDDCSLEHSNCSQTHKCVYHIATKAAYFCIRSLDSKHSGVYWVTLFFKKSTVTLLHSNKLSLHLGLDNGTKVHPTSNQNTVRFEGSSSPGSSLIILAVLGVLTTVLLSGLFVGFCLKRRLSSDTDQQDDLIAKSQVTVEESKAGATVYSVEYGVLDFQHRGGEADQGTVIRSADSVEYSAITFQRQQQGACRR